MFPRPLVLLHLLVASLRTRVGLALQSRWSSGPARGPTLEQADVFAPEEEQHPYIGTRDARLTVHDLGDVFGEDEGLLVPHVKTKPARFRRAGESFEDTGPPGAGHDQGQRLPPFEDELRAMLRPAIAEVGGASPPSVAKDASGAGARRSPASSTNKKHAPPRRVPPATKKPRPEQGPSAQRSSPEQLRSSSMSVSLLNPLLNPLLSKPPALPLLNPDYFFRKIYTLSDGPIPFVAIDLPDML